MILDRERDDVLLTAVREFWHLPPWHCIAQYQHHMFYLFSVCFGVHFSVSTRGLKVAFCVAFPPDETCEWENK